MKALAHITYPNLMEWPTLFWHSRIRTTIEAAFLESNFKNSSIDFVIGVNSELQADLHVFLEFSSSNLERVKRISGQKLLICGEATSLLPESQRIGVLFNRTWDRVFTWNRSFKSEKVIHFDFADGLTKTPRKTQTARHTSDSILFFYYSPEAPLSLKVFEKIRKLSQMTVVPVDLCSVLKSPQKHQELLTLSNAKAIYYSNLAWHAGFKSCIEEVAKECKIHFHQISWNPRDITPNDSLEVVREKIASSRFSDEKGDSLKKLLQDFISSRFHSKNELRTINSGQNYVS